MTLTTDSILDLLIVGSGPHALSLVSHLLEKSPFDFVDDADQQRLYNLNRKESLKSSIQSSFPCCSQDLNPESIRKNILVIDGNGSWMKKWNNSFQVLNINHLRSPIFFHPDPFDPNALRSFAENEERICELHDITGIVDGCKKCKKQKKKSHLTENDREQFYTPSQSLFSHFCSTIVDRYFLHGIVTKGWVTSIVPIRDEEHGNIFKIIYSIEEDEANKPLENQTKCCANDHFDQKQIKVIYARKVVCALGNNNTPSLPDFVQNIPPNSYPPCRLIHSIELANKSKSPVPLEFCNGENSRLLVIGGGLTSAQLVDLGVNSGFKNIVLACRSNIKTKPFDLDLEWIGRYSRILHHNFWKSDSQSRRSIISKARNGASITPEYRKLLDDLIKKSILQIYQKSIVSKATWNHQNKYWEVYFDKNEHSENFDMIWMGTGAIMNIHNEPCLSHVLEKNPIPIYGGLPELTNDLKWPGLELYMMSGYCALTLGPSATNLLGGRFAAQRISNVLWQKWLDDFNIKVDKEKVEAKPNLKTIASMTGSFINYYEGLCEE